MGGMSGHKRVEVMGCWKNCIIKKFVHYTVGVIISRLRIETGRSRCYKRWMMY
jgi:hypothetical protein